jgi:hypothetical protein
MMLKFISADNWTEFCKTDLFKTPPYHPPEKLRFQSAKTSGTGHKRLKHVAALAMPKGNKTGDR